MFQPIALALAGSLALAGPRAIPQVAADRPPDSTFVRQWRERSHCGGACGVGEGGLGQEAGGHGGEDGLGDHGVVLL